MKCFQFYNSGDKKTEPKAAKSISLQSTCSTVRPSGSEFTSQNISCTSTESIGRSPFPSLYDRPNNLRDFSISELKSATKNFNRTVKIGEGGFGCVYKGVVKSVEEPGQKVDVAVKKLGKRGSQGHKEWVTEVNVLGVVEHPNLVKLVGYCADDDERGIQRLLVYEFMPNKSVDDHLSAKSESPLPWSLRLRVAQDAARGLTYLHEGMDFQVWCSPCKDPTLCNEIGKAIIFRDFKSSNILLDDQWNAKLSDFGLARLGPTEGLSHVSTAVVGTLGYAAPEYIQTSRLTSKSDVWSYGVFLYELITGRRPLDRNRPKHEQRLLEWVKPFLSDSKKFRHILDPRLDRMYLCLKSAHKLAIVANRCLIRHPKSRPKMSEILEMVNQIVDSSQELNTLEFPEKRLENEEGKRIVSENEMKESGCLYRICSSNLVKVC